MTVAELKAELAKYPDDCEVKHTIDPMNDVTPLVYIGIDEVTAVADTEEDFGTGKETVLLVS